MIDISSLGGGTLAIASKDLTVISNPNRQLKPTKLKGNVILSAQPYDLAAGTDVRLSIDGPGDYEVADFTIQGIGAKTNDGMVVPGGDTIYQVRQADISLAILGRVQLPLTEPQTDSLGVIDIMTVALAGRSLADLPSIIAVVKSVEPKVLIPVVDNRADAGQSELLRMLVDELGVTKESSSKLKVKGRSNLPATLTIVDISE